MVVFVKQKTAYEWRISDWSSDVCSSDLLRAVPPPDGRTEHRLRAGNAGPPPGAARPAGRADARPGEARRLRQPPAGSTLRRPAAARGARPRAGERAQGAAARRATLGARPQAAQGNADRAEAPADGDRHHLRLCDPRPGRSADRKSVVTGQRVSVRVDFGGRRIIKKKKNTNTKKPT